MQVIDGKVVTTAAEDRALNALTRAESGPAWSRASAYVIINKKTGEWGRLKVAHPADGMGPLRAFLWAPKCGLQYGTASGCGYDKLASAMRGMKYDALTLGDHCEGSGAWRSCLESHGYEVIQAI